MPGSPSAENPTECSSGCRPEATSQASSELSTAVMSCHVVVAAVRVGVGRADHRAAVGARRLAGVGGQLVVVHRAAEPHLVRMPGRADHEGVVAALAVLAPAVGGEAVRAVRGSSTAPSSPRCCSGRRARRPGRRRRLSGTPAEAACPDRCPRRSRPTSRPGRRESVPRSTRSNSVRSPNESPTGALGSEKSFWLIVWKTCVQVVPPLAERQSP